MDDKTRNKIDFYLEQILLSAHDINTQDVFIRKQLRMVNSYVTEIQRLLK